MDGLNRFLAAQSSAYAAALEEIRAGKKRNHWMWYIFPQLRGLGSSPTSQAYAIQDMDEARTYLAHSVLRGNLTEICEALLSLDSDDANQIFGWPDCMKLRSSMTLFALAEGGNSVFQQVLDKFFSGAMDQRTLDILEAQRR